MLTTEGQTTEAFRELFFPNGPPWYAYETANDLFVRLRRRLPDVDEEFELDFASLELYELVLLLGKYFIVSGFVHIEPFIWQSLDSRDISNLR